MLGNIRKFFNSLPIDETRVFAPDDHRVMVAALLVHVMAADGKITEAEHRKLKALLKSGFGLDDDETAALIAEATLRDKEAVDLYSFTSIIKRALDEDGRLRLIEMLWDMAFADGHVDEFEYNVIWRIAELIGISTRNRLLLQKKVVARD
jgi:uncharacterized tellurite resistance protein B-like protein